MTGAEEQGNHSSLRVRGGLLVIVLSMANKQFIAPAGKFRVVGFDADNKSYWIVGDYDSFEESMKVASEKQGIAITVDIYNDKGEPLASYGQ